MILHDLKDHNRLMAIGDFIVKMADDYFAKPLLLDLNPLNELGIIRKVNQALRQPLEISDFVRPSKPLLRDYEFEPYGADRYDKEAFNDDLDEWKNWKPLFEGWKVIRENDIYIDIRKGRDNYRWRRDLGVDRESFIRYCKKGNINP